jgi:hypothetical protein
MQIIRDGFVWFDVTKKAKEVYASRLFELYLINEEGSPLLVQNYTDLNEALELGIPIAVPVDLQVDQLKLMYGFVTDLGKKLKKDYKSIPKKDRLFTYEQFIVARFSNLIDGRLWNEENFIIATDLTEDQIVSVLSPFVERKRDLDEDYTNEDLVDELEYVYQDSTIIEVNPKRISI